MTSNECARRGHRVRAIAAVCSAAMMLAVVALATPAQAATFTVDCSSQNLQTKINAAPAGSTLLIKGTCLGSFLVDKNLTLKGNPSATLDGNDAGTTLTAPSTRTVHLIALEITGGSATLGAGILRLGGGHALLSLDHVTVADNVAWGPGAGGGGIATDGGPTTLTDSAVIHNRSSASSSSGPATAHAGGILSSGPLTLVRSTVSSNRAVATSSVDSASATGGGVFGGGVDANLVMKSSHVDGNHATATTSAAAGSWVATALAGGIDWSSTGQLVVQTSTMSGNVASSTAVSNTAEAQGGGLVGTFKQGTASGWTVSNNHVVATGVNPQAKDGGWNTSVGAGGLTLAGTRVTGSQATASGAGPAWAATGGFSNTGPLILRSSSVSFSVVRADSVGPGEAIALFGGFFESGPLSMTKTTVDQNHLIADSDSGRATARFGGMEAGVPSVISASTISRNTVKATAHGVGEALAGTGGVVIPWKAGPPPLSRITNSTVASNIVRAESDPATGTAEATGGGIQSGGSPLLLTNTTIARNVVSGVGNTTTFRGGGLIVNGGTTTLKAAILALNIAPAAGGPNCFGPVHSKGHNVLGTTTDCTFTIQASDQLDSNPRLGALAPNGGPTRTLALLNGSPALDDIPPAVCAVAVDQRGVHRPQGPRCDVGSYERKV
ncbi:MAG: choice-of-anchor Q domain-containing protein [Actinomycetota bacterium]